MVEKKYLKAFWLGFREGKYNDGRVHQADQSWNEWYDRGRALWRRSRDN